MGKKSALDFSFTSSAWYKLGAHHWTDAVRSDPPVLFEQALLRPWESEAASRTRPCFNQESMDWFMGKRIGNTEFFTIKTDVGFFFKEHFKQISDSKAGENCCSCVFSWVTKSLGLFFLLTICLWFPQIHFQRLFFLIAIPSKKSFQNHTITMWMIGAGDDFSHRQDGPRKMSGGCHLQKVLETSWYHRMCPWCPNSGMNLWVES